LGLIITGGILIVVFVFWGAYGPVVVSQISANSDAELYSGVPNPLVPMHFFKDIRGFVCLVIIGSVSGVMYVALSIIWPSRKYA
jgi:hypothetical protein